MGWTDISDVPFFMPKVIGVLKAEYWQAKGPKTDSNADGMISIYFVAGAKLSDEVGENIISGNAQKDDALLTWILAQVGMTQEMFDEDIWAPKSVSDGSGGKDVPGYQSKAWHKPAIGAFADYSVWGGMYCHTFTWSAIQSYTGVGGSAKYFTTYQSLLDALKKVPRYAGPKPIPPNVKLPGPYLNFRRFQGGQLARAR